MISLCIAFLALKGLVSCSPTTQQHNQRALWPGDQLNSSVSVPRHSANIIAPDGYSVQFGYGTNPLKEVSAYFNTLLAMTDEAVQDYSGFITRNKTYNEAHPRGAELILTVGQAKPLPRSFFLAAMNDIAQLLSAAWTLGLTREMTALIYDDEELIAALHIWNSRAPAALGTTNANNETLGVTAAAMNTTYPGHILPSIPNSHTNTSVLVSRATYYKRATSDVHRNLGRRSSKSPSRRARTGTRTLVPRTDPDDISITEEFLEGPNIIIAGLVSCAARLLHFLGTCRPNAPLPIFKGFDSDPKFGHQLTIANPRPDLTGDPIFDKENLIEGLWVYLNRLSDPELAGNEGIEPDSAFAPERVHVFALEVELGYWEILRLTSDDDDHGSDDEGGDGN